MFRDLLAMKIDIEMLKTAFGKSLKVGPIEQIDAKKGYRIKLGEDENGEPFLSPWYPHPESGGATSTWAPLSKGQIVGMINPTGDARQGILLRGGFSDINRPPSADLLASVLKAFGVTVTVRTEPSLSTVISWSKATPTSRADTSSTTTPISATRIFMAASNAAARQPTNLRTERTHHDQKDLSRPARRGLGEWRTCAGFRQSEPDRNRSSF